nr:hypothetical protein [Tanacetum cinerariifolium]
IEPTDMKGMIAHRRRPTMNEQRAFRTLGYAASSGVKGLVDNGTASADGFEFSGYYCHGKEECRIFVLSESVEQRHPGDHFPASSSPKSTGTKFT